MYNDFKMNPQAPHFAHLQHLLDVSEKESYTNKEIEKSFMDMTKTMFVDKVSSSLAAPKNIGNMYCGSLYSYFSNCIS